MTDHAEPDPDDDAVRRLLADARHTEPMPDGVAARMDAVLADLAADAHATPPDPVVVPLNIHRRRRAAGMLVAAAAIVVGGVVVAQHLPGAGDSSGATATAGDRADSSSVAGDASGTPSVRTPVPEHAAPGHLPLGAAEVRHGRVQVRPQQFTADAVAARRLVQQRLPLSSYTRLGHPGGSCAVPAHAGVRVAATYQRAPAVLVFHAPVSSTQVVDLYLCGSRRPVRSATLPSP